MARLFWAVDNSHSNNHLLEQMYAEKHTLNTNTEADGHKTTIGAAPIS